MVLCCPFSHILKIRNLSNRIPEIDRIVRIDKRQRVATGESVEAIILNALGFVSKPLYLFPEFMKIQS